MEPMSVPPALRARIGHEATQGLVELLETRDRMWSEHMMDLAVERFERRLAEELWKFRLAVTQEIATSRVELLRRSFVFWVGQMTALAALVALVLRTGH